jgi:serine/threonine protein kinase
MRKIIGFILLWSKVKRILQKFWRINKKIGAFFDEETIRIYMRQLIQAVGHMHEVGYFHRDLKPENMILVNDKDIKLIDFGT